MSGWPALIPRRSLQQHLWTFILNMGSTYQKDHTTAFVNRVWQAYLITFYWGQLHLSWRDMSGWPALILRRSLQQHFTQRGHSETFWSITCLTRNISLGELHLSWRGVTLYRVACSDFQKEPTTTFVNIYIEHWLRIPEVTCNSICEQIERTIAFQTAWSQWNLLVYDVLTS